jgi:hypothetical protein
LNIEGKETYRMAKTSLKSKDGGHYVWRGGQKIELEKQGGRFTVQPSSPEQLERVHSAPGVRAVKPVTNEVFKIETTATERHVAMVALRSDAFNAVVHHAYKPKDSEGSGLLPYGQSNCVAGVAALMLSANPELMASEVKEILQSTADKIVDGDPDIVLGTNRGRYNNRGRCDWFGYGKVNAAKAVAEAKRRADA